MQVGGKITIVPSAKLACASAQSKKRQYKKHHDYKPNDVNNGIHDQSPPEFSTGLTKPNPD
jgi:hypothetical protein